ncbi:hypothetical protein [Brochothrix thermosphacta]|uniref:hypothetical protein n=1 Tax=Brochothrix thermosphacta TaxID=2756 RepID=UPI0003E86D60|nr:hypothetical protein [Brochothrix thermosphacta]EUJ38170.1 hypothetical protein BTHER_02305 [Brochothrix thermosphacta DSM 20171 = FSL F6-1036]ODJ49232.1 hypothetical protein BFR34_06240 [Brochothrix thermosphacta DSM 20171 = FSL F6-1036]
MYKPFVVTYDLGTPGANYEKVYETIQSFGSSIRFQKSVWLVKTNLTSEQMYLKLKPVLDNDDFIFICALEKNYYGWASQENWDFLRNDIFN